MLDRKNAPLRVKSASVPAMDYPKTVSGTGMPCYTVEGGTEDIVKIDVVFKAGTRYESKPLLATTCSQMLKEGTAKYTAEEIAETLDFYGAQVDTDVSKDRAEISLLCLGKHFDKLMDLFISILLEPSFPERELSLVKKRAASALEVNLNKVQFACRLLFNEALFKELPYRDRYDADYYRDIAAKDLEHFFNKHYNLADAYCVVSGLNSLQVRDKFLKALEARAPRSERRSIESFAWDFTAEEFRIEKDEAVQSAIRMGIPAVSRTHPDYPAFYTANVALGGYFGSRLMQNIREEKGYTYGIGSVMNLMEDAAYLSISTEVGAEFTERTITEIKKELKRLMNEPLPVEELELIQHFVAGNLLKSFDGPFSIADRFKTALAFDLQGDFYSEFTRAIFALKPEDVLELARERFDPDGFSLAVVGKW